jgi:hypothetical protein
MQPAGEHRARWVFAAGLLAIGACESFHANLPGGDAGATDGGDPTRDAAPSPDAAPPADAAPPGTQSTTVFSYDDIEDTFLRLSDPTFNYGGRERMCTDTTTDDRRMLLRIDVSALPAGAEVVAADLHLWTGTLASDPSVQTCSIYQMLESWDEGDEDTAVGTASWNERKSDTAWTVEGAGVGSRADQVMGSFVPAAFDTEYVIPVEPALIQDWIDDPAGNFGVAIISAGSDGGCFETTEYSVEAKRPSLSVTWIAP